VTNPIPSIGNFGIDDAQSKRPLNLIFLLDCSSSMSGEKIASLNMVMQEAVQNLQRIDKAPDTYGKMQFRAIAFASGAWWHVQDATDLQKVVWSNLPANGSTDLGAALRMLNDALEPQWLGMRLLPPVLVLLSDGQPTDNWQLRLTDLRKNRFWKHCVRIAIGIGQDSKGTEATQALTAFIDPKDPKEVPTLLYADNHEQLAEYIRWASTVVTTSISTGTSGDPATMAQGQAVALPSLPTVPAAATIW